jgi:hypothetical protein
MSCRAFAYLKRVEIAAADRKGFARKKPPIGLTSGGKVSASLPLKSKRRQQIGRFVIRAWRPSISRRRWFAVLTWPLLVTAGALPC